MNDEAVEQAASGEEIDGRGDVSPGGGLNALVVTKSAAELLFDAFELAVAQQPWGVLSKDEIEAEVMGQVLEDVAKCSVGAQDILVVARLLIKQTNIAFQRRNESVNKAVMGKFQALTSLTNRHVAHLLLALYNIKNIAVFGLCVDSMFDQLAVRIDDLKHGVYVTDERLLTKLVRECKPSVTVRELDEVRGLLKTYAPRVAPTSLCDPDKESRQVLIPVRNGVFDRRTMALREYGEEEVFLTRTERDFPKVAPAEPTFEMPDGTVMTYTDWERALFEGLPDQDEVHRLLVQIISAAFRPAHNWKRVIFFHGPSGNSGKSSILELIENIYGRDSRQYASIPVTQWGERFGLVELETAVLVMAHENSVSEFGKNMGNFKAAVTGETITLEKKGQDSYGVRWKGLIIQAMNSFIQTSDKSGSFARRQLWVPFNQNYEGREVPDIKYVFLASDAVLDFVFYRALTDACEELSNPRSCQILKGEAVEANNPVEKFWREMSDKYVWNHLPIDFLQDHFNAWRERYNPNSLPMNSGPFRDLLMQVVANDPNWDVDRSQQRVGSRFGKTELMIHEYQLERWSNPGYKGGDPFNYSATPVPASKRFSNWIVRTSAGFAAQASALVAAVAVGEPEECMSDSVADPTKGVPAELAA